MKKFLFTLAFGMLAQNGFSQQTKISVNMEKQTNQLQFQEMYFVIVTNKLAETKAFYETLFGFRPLFESSWFHYLQSPGEQPFGLAIMDEKHPTHPPSLPAFQAKSGVFMTLQVASAEAEYKKMKALKANLVYELKQEPWGQKRFSMQDPNGLFIDVVEQTEPQAGWWDAYMPKSE